MCCRNHSVHSCRCDCCCCCCWCSWWWLFLLTRFRCYLCSFFGCSSISLSLPAFLPSTYVIIFLSYTMVISFSHTHTRSFPLSGCFFSWISIFHLALWIFISFSIIVFVRVSVCKCLLPLTNVSRDSRKQESGSNWTTNSMKFSPFKWRSYKS